MNVSIVIAIVTLYWHFDKVGIMLYIDHIWTNCNDYSMYMYIYNYTYQITMIDNITVSGSS